jgi:Tol biopolymer transport system component
MCRTTWLSLVIAALLACSNSTEHTESTGLRGRIVFSREATPGFYGLYSMMANGQDVRPLHTSTEISLILPVVSPDGETVAVTGIRFGTNTPGLFLLRNHATTLDCVSLTADLKGASWSPDGRQLVIGCFDQQPPAGEAPASLCLVNSDGTGLHRIVHSPVSRWWPTWGPDGAEIAFLSDSVVDSTLGALSRVFAMSVASGAIRRVTQDTFPVDQPAWSPEGSSITFVAAPNASPLRPFLVRPDGSGQQEIAAGPGPTGCPVVGPKGDKVLLYRDRQIYLAALSGANSRALTTDTLESLWPSWGPSP